MLDLLVDWAKWCKSMKLRPEVGRKVSWAPTSDYLVGLGHRWRVVKGDKEGTYVFQIGDPIKEFDRWAAL